MSRVVDKNCSFGFSLVELLVVVAVLAVLLAIALPAVAGARRDGLRAKALVQARSLSTAVLAYSIDSQGKPPALFRPAIEFAGVHPPQVWSRNGVDTFGWWFSSTYAYQRMLRESSSDLPVASPRTPEPILELSNDNDPQHFPLTESLYADPALFSTGTSSVGVHLMKLQRMDDIVYPSKKGIIQQIAAYYEPGARDPSNPNGTLALWSLSNVPGAVVWGDLSGSREFQGRLLPGVPNSLDHVLISEGQSVPIPIARTRNGIAGHDR